MSTSDGRKTPLYEFHLQNHAKFVDFAGWTMPIQYTSILEEHKKTRETAGLFDVSHMGEFLIEGKNALNDVDSLITNDLSGIETGQALYSPMCREDGGVVDDLILYKRSNESIFICCNAANISQVGSWFSEKLSESSSQVENQSSQYAQIAVQGPAAIEIIEQVCPGSSSSIKRFHFAETTIQNRPVILSRTGYTGEDGFEIYCSPDHAMELVGNLNRVGTPLGMVPVGLGARDSLRLEAGYPLYGHEISESISPIEGGLGWTVKFQKSGSFTGKEALLAQKNSPEIRKTFHFITEDKRIAREGAEVFSKDEKVGHVLSGSFSPLLQCGIGSAIVNKSTTLDDDLSVQIRNRSLKISAHKPPLHKTI